MPEASLKKNHDLSPNTIKNACIPVSYKEKTAKSFHDLNGRLEKPFPPAIVIAYIQTGNPYAASLLGLHENLQFLPSLLYSLNRNTGSICLAMRKFIRV
jgi:hypothetical protein